MRTSVPEDRVGDHEEGPHRDNLRDVGRRYADISTADDCIGNRRCDARAPALT